MGVGQEQAKAEEKNEEKTEEKPPLPFVLFVDLHCVGCAKKIEKSLFNIRGVEGVVIDMVKNQVTIKGVVEPQAICNKIMKKTKRRAKVLSPLPSAEVVASQVSGLNTVELNVNMHCEACALQLKKKILKMKGVRTVETELSSTKVTVTGTMDSTKLVDYVYRRTKKQAKIVPQPEPENQPTQEPKPAEEKKDEPKSEEEKKEDPIPEKEQKEEPAPTDKKDENAPEEEKKESKGDEEKSGENKEEEEGAKKEIHSIYDENTMQRMFYNYQPLYHVFERMPPPQLFSDENPNACCIS
ncbi:hypothetical protein LguiA_031726 [Lonicera macranthoides]